MDGKIYTQVIQAKDVTQEILDMAWSVIEGWYNSGDDRIDWDDVWDRLDGSSLDDGTFLDLGDQEDTPAMRKIQREMRKIINEW